MYNLYYLCDQTPNADLTGEKWLVLSTDVLLDCYGKATIDQIIHYSIELVDANGNVSIMTSV